VELERGVRVPASAGPGSIGGTPRKCGVSGPRPCALHTAAHSRPCECGEAGIWVEASRGGAAGWAGRGLALGLGWAEAGREARRGRGAMGGLGLDPSRRCAGRRSSTQRVHASALLHCAPPRPSHACMTRICAQACARETRESWQSSLGCAIVSAGGPVEAVVVSGSAVGGAAL
jgi:hypothetical protein